MEAILVPSRGACSRKQRKGGWLWSSPENRELGRLIAPGATPQVLRPCKVFRDIHCLSWNHSEKCVQLCSLSR